VAADVALTGTSDLVDVTDLGLGRFDASGRSRLATDPIALPFPEAVQQPGARQGDGDQFAGDQAPGKLTIS
jgi:hypothetical protein